MPGLLDRIERGLQGVGRGVGAVGSGIGDILAAGGNAYAPQDMNLNRNQQMGLLSNVLGDMTIGPRGQRQNNTPGYLNDIRNDQTRSRLREAIQALDIEDSEKAALLVLPEREQAAFLQGFPERQRQQTSQENILRMLEGGNTQGSTGLLNNNTLGQTYQPGMGNYQPPSMLGQQSGQQPGGQSGAGLDPLFQAMIREQIASGDTSGALGNMYSRQESQNQLGLETQEKNQLLAALQGMEYSDDFMAIAQGLPAEDIRALMEKEDTRSREEKSRKFTQGTTLRGEYLSGSEDFQTRQDKYGQISDFAQDPSAAGDIAMVFAYMKLLDPNSVVRESEYATAASAGPLVDAATVGVYNRLLRGERLTPLQRADFFDSAGKLFTQAADSYELHRGAYETQAANSGLDFDLDVYPGELQRFFDEDMPTEEMLQVIRDHTIQPLDGQGQINAAKAQLQVDGTRAVQVEDILNTPGGDAELMSLGFADRGEAQEFLDYFIDNALIVDPTFEF